MLGHDEDLSKSIASESRASRNISGPDECCESDKPVTGDVVLRIPFVYMAAKIEDLISETLRFSVELAKTGATPEFHFILF
jgi:hypothetical protein